jgi:hypothetical protein
MDDASTRDADADAARRAPTHADADADASGYFTSRSLDTHARSNAREDARVG